MTPDSNFCSPYACTHTGTQVHTNMVTSIYMSEDENCRYGSQILGIGTMLVRLEHFHFDSNDYYP